MVTWLVVAGVWPEPMELGRVRLLVCHLLYEPICNLPKGALSETLGICGP